MFYPQNLFYFSKGEMRIKLVILFHWNYFLQSQLISSFCQTDIIAMQYDYIKKQLLYAYSDLYTKLHRFCERNNIFPSDLILLLMWL